MNSTDVSVIIPAYNEPRNVQQVLRSLTRQVCRLGCVEVIIVDDGSDPPLKDSLGDLLDHDMFRIVRNDTNLGRGATRNAGVRESVGDLIIFLDSDMTVHPEFISHHIKAHDSENGIACVGKVVWIGTTTLHRYLETRGIIKLCKGQAVPWRYFISGNTSLKKKDFERAGLFHEGITGWGGEDTLMGFDLYQKDISIRYIEEAVSYHHRMVDLDQVCSQNYRFGRQSLPIMIASRPGISREMRAHYFQEPDSGSSWRERQSIHRLFIRGILQFPGDRIARSFLRIPVIKILFSCYDYLVYFNILRGYRDSMMDGDQVSGMPGSKVGSPETRERGGEET